MDSVAASEAVDPGSTPGIRTMAIKELQNSDATSPGLPPVSKTQG